MASLRRVLPPSLSSCAICAVTRAIIASPEIGAAWVASWILASEAAVAVTVVLASNPLDAPRMAQ
ncbi:hypothetical protein GCM10008965_16570 [Methylorubrum aminovorans]